MPIQRDRETRSEVKSSSYTSSISKVKNTESSKEFLWFDWKGRASNSLSRKGLFSKRRFLVCTSPPGRTRPKSGRSNRKPEEVFSI
jgi:hypothetical protein